MQLPAREVCPQGRARWRRRRRWRLRHRPRRRWRRQPCRAGSSQTLARRPRRPRRQRQLHRPQSRGPHHRCAARHRHRRQRRNSPIHRTCGARRLGLASCPSVTARTFAMANPSRTTDAAKAVLARHPTGFADRHNTQIGHLSRFFGLRHCIYRLDSSRHFHGNACLYLLGSPSR